ncbi:MAG: ABC transporter ATP-binding protein [Xanthobacteraceae bacterium]|jgi:branched-chain amino acid transport system ATP-binding protein|nr:ABC transporter ATP-binding protein [Xanthobacteraceae bacterium]
MSTLAILAENINTHYGRSHILRGVSFRVAPGETVSLLGRNGMGKTTLLRTLAGLVRPSSGRVQLNGNDVTLSRASVRSRAGLAIVPEGRGIFPNLTVAENLTFASRTNSKGERPWPLERVYALFPRLSERKHHWGNELSGGEQQMLSIGRALMTSPSIVLLDEATEGLAPKLRDEIWSTVKQITESGIAAIIVDKNLNDLLALADRNTIMAKGEIVFDGSSAALRADEALIHRHLGV